MAKVWKFLEYVEYIRDNKSDVKNIDSTWEYFDDSNRYNDEDYGPFSQPLKGIRRTYKPLDKDSILALKDKTITSICTCEGTYGMGGAGMVSFTISAKEKLVYRLWGADNWLSVNDLPLAGNEKKLACPLKIKDVKYDVEKNSLVLDLLDKNGTSVCLKTLDAWKDLVLDNSRPIHEGFSFAHPMSTLWI